MRNNISNYINYKVWDETIYTFLAVLFPALSMARIYYSQCLKAL